MSDTRVVTEWNRRPADPLELLAALKVPEGKSPVLTKSAKLDEWRFGYMDTPTVPQANEMGCKCIGWGPTPRAAILSAVAKQQEAEKPKVDIAALNKARQEARITYENSLQAYLEALIAAGEKTRERLDREDANA